MSGITATGREFHAGRWIETPERALVVATRSVEVHISPQLAVAGPWQHLDCALYVVAAMTGLREGELRALRCGDVDLEAGTINVARSWDDAEGEQDRGKSRAAERTVALIGELRAILAAHLMATGRRDNDLVFGRAAEQPFTPTTVRSRALRAWGWREDVDRKRKPGPPRPSQSSGRSYQWTLRAQ